MHLTGTQTLINLARGFAGETQARTRYIFYAQTARKENLAYMASMIDEIIRNELAHAQVFFDFIVKGTNNNANNIAFTAGFPYQEAELLNNLQYSFEAEKEECDVLYPQFAQVAKQEGFPEIATAFEQIAKIEGSHHNIFFDLHEQLSGNQLYSKPSAVEWKCSHCGHISNGTQSFAVCPVCKKPQGYVEIHLKGN